MMNKPLFWPVTPSDFARSLKWARTQPNPVALAIKRRLDSHHPTSSITARR